MMNWYKIKDNRINLSMAMYYRPIGDYNIDFRDHYMTFDTKEERDAELRKLDEALERGLHCISEFKLP